MNRVSIVFYRIVLVLCLAIVLARPVAAEEVTLNFSDADLVAVINSVSQITGKNFIIDPRVKGKVTVPTSNAIKIMPDATAKQSAAPFTNKRSTPEDQLITRVLKINFIFGDYTPQWQRRNPGI